MFDNVYPTACANFTGRGIFFSIVFPLLRVDGEFLLKVEERGGD